MTILFIVLCLLCLCAGFYALFLCLTLKTGVVSNEFLKLQGVIYNHDVKKHFEEAK